MSVYLICLKNTFPLMPLFQSNDLSIFHVRAFAFATSDICNVCVYFFRSVEPNLSYPLTFWFKWAILKDTSHGYNLIVTWPYLLSSFIVFLEFFTLTLSFNFFQFMYLFSLYYKETFIKPEITYQLLASAFSQTRGEPGTEEHLFF